jgi:hypothetical protein
MGPAYYIHVLIHYLSLANEFLNYVNVNLLRAFLAVVIILADNALEEV